jgi:hypothetical protein
VERNEAENRGGKDKRGQLCGHTGVASEKWHARKRKRLAGGRHLVFKAAGREYASVGKGRRGAEFQQKGRGERGATDLGRPALLPRLLGRELSCKMPTEASAELKYSSEKKERSNVSFDFLLAADASSQIGIRGNRHPHPIDTVLAQYSQQGVAGSAAKLQACQHSLASKRPFQGGTTRLSNPMSRKATL